MQETCKFLIRTIKSDESSASALKSHVDDYVDERVGRISKRRQPKATVIGAEREGGGRLKRVPPTKIQ